MPSIKAATRPPDTMDVRTEGRSTVIRPARAPSSVRYDDADDLSDGPENDEADDQWTDQPYLPLDRENQGADDRDGDGKQAAIDARQG